jgi:hypothetical protein
MNHFGIAELTIAFLIDERKSMMNPDIKDRDNHPDQITKNNKSLNPFKDEHLHFLKMESIMNDLFDDETHEDDFDLYASGIFG